ncbi:hypothetical protein [Pseudarthrobacter sp. S9]|uniref:hypothetical protein n=1 Tax=Pseudarthrobacter sp. S9 TaxID=3418421 RepID=UPI003D024E01
MSESATPAPGRQAGGRPATAGYVRRRLHPEVLTTQQIREVGRRRTEAEEKLSQHLRDARHKNPDTADSGTQDNP